MTLTRAQSAVSAYVTSKTAYTSAVGAPSGPTKLAWPQRLSTTESSAITTLARRVPYARRA